MSKKSADFTTDSVRYVSASVIDVNEKWLHAAKRCERYTLLAIQRGEMRGYTSVGTLTVGTSQALLLSPMTRIRSAYSQDFGVRFFCAELELAQDFLEAMTLYSLSAFDFELLNKLVKTSSENEQSLADALLFSLLCDMKKAPVSEQESAQIIAKALESDSFAEIDIDKLADKTGVSKARLLKAFGEITGKSPKAYANEKRVAHARTLLTYSAFTVSKIASLLNFDDANLFTKFFTYHTGVTPSDYRRALNNIPARSKRM